MSSTNSLATNGSTPAANMFLYSSVCVGSVLPKNHPVPKSTSLPAASACAFISSNEDLDLPLASSCVKPCCLPSKYLTPLAAPASHKFWNPKNKPRDAPFALSLTLIASRNLEKPFSSLFKDSFKTICPNLGSSSLIPNLTAPTKEPLLIVGYLLIIEEAWLAIACVACVGAKDFCIALSVAESSAKEAASKVLYAMLPF